MKIDKKKFEVKCSVIQFFKVQTFWEADKKLRNLPHALDIYLVNVQSMRKIFSNSVCFSESPNFKSLLMRKYLVDSNNTFDIKFTKQAIS